MSTIVNFSIFPVDKGERLSKYVAESIKIVKDSGLPYKLGPMGTSIEGQWNDIIDVITRCFDNMKQNSSRVYMTMNVDFRKGKDSRLKGKIDSVNEKI